MIRTKMTSLFSLALMAFAAVPAFASQYDCSYRNGSPPGFTSGQNDVSNYASTPLGIAHMLLDFLNDGYGYVPQGVMCHFTQDMGMPSNFSLPFTTTKTFNGHTVTLTVSTPTEGFAAGTYTAKGVVTVDGASFMSMWWAGSGTSSKGFLIMPYNSVLNALPSTHPMYIVWDQTDSTNQVIKVWAGQFAENPVSSLSSGDQIMYGRVTYNAKTGAISDQMVMVKNNSGQIQCHRGVIVAGSVLGSSLDFATDTGGTAITSSSSGWSSTDGTGMSENVYVDSTSTTSGSSGSSSFTLDNSCADVLAAISTGGVLSGGDASLTQVPSALFTN